jgi:hypothetical protein
VELLALALRIRDKVSSGRAAAAVLAALAPCARRLRSFELSQFSSQAIAGANVLTAAYGTARPPLTLSR